MKLIMNFTPTWDANLSCNNCGSTLLKGFNKPYTLPEKCTRCKTPLWGLLE